MSFTDGWVKLHRSLLNKPDILFNPTVLQIWIYLLLRASWQGDTPRRGRENGQDTHEKLPPGTVVLGLRECSKTLGISKDTLLRWLKYLEKRDTIKVKSDTLGTVITICNWKEYQVSEENTDTISRHLLIRSQDTCETLTSPVLRYKEGKKNNNGRNKTSPDTGILEDLYQLYPRRYGDQRKKEGMKVLQKIVATRGTEDIRKAIMNYATHCNTEDKTGTSGVQQFKTFVSQTWEEWITPPNGKAHLTEEEKLKRPGFTLQE